MKRSALGMVIASFLAACGGDPAAGPHYRATGTATACETLEWAKTHDDLLDSENPAAARQFAADRCFNVEQSQRLYVTDQPFGGFLRGPNRWVQVAAADEGSIEHMASAELRRTLGLEARRAGWLRRGQLEELP